MAIDLTVLQQQRISNTSHISIAGVLVEKAAKTTHRHRQEDLFAIQLVTSGSDVLPGKELDELAKKASGIFFHTQGSVTRSIQSVIDELNKDLYLKNTELGLEGDQVYGSINICVIHNEHLFVGQTGDAVVYHIGDNIFETFGEDKIDQSKLGISRRAHVRFYQCAISAGDLLLMSPRSHGSWKSYYLADSHKIPLDQLNRRLQNQMIQDYCVVVIKTSEGNGEVHRGIWPQTDQIDSKVAQESPKENRYQPDNENEYENENDGEKVDSKKSDNTIPGTRKPAIVEADPSDDEGMHELLPGGTSPDEEFAEKVPISEGQTEGQSEFGVKTKLVTNSRKSSQEGGFLRALARTWMAGKTFKAKMRLFADRIRRKIMPDRVLSPERLKGWQSSVILAFPIVLTTISILLYTNFGKEEQYQSFMDQALERSVAAEQAASNEERKNLWLEVMNFASGAENYKITNESRQLFLRAQSIIDEMDLSTRLEFRPAMTQPFPEEVQVTKITDSTSGIYMLNSASGNVLRVSMNSKGFLEIDPDFNCVPGGYGIVQMGNIVDFVVLPANKMGYKILAVDENGDLLYCQPGEIPDSKTLTLPKGGWGKITQMIYSEDRLIVIDALANEIYVYESSRESDVKGIVFSEAPTSFFDAEIPDIGGAIEAVLNQDDLYILHEDGHMTLCQYGYENVRPTECEDPAPYTDNREGSENKKPWIFMGTNFISMTRSALPNPSLFILDRNSQSFFEFSMQLNLEKTYKPQNNPDFPLPDTNPTGFGILIDQQLLVAYSNQIFTTALR